MKWKRLAISGEAAKAVQAMWRLRPDEPDLDLIAETLDLAYRPLIEEPAGDAAG